MRKAGCAQRRRGIPRSKTPLEQGRAEGVAVHVIVVEKKPCVGNLTRGAHMPVVANTALDSALVVGQNLHQQPWQMQGALRV